MSDFDYVQALYVLDGWPKSGVLITNVELRFFVFDSKALLTPIDVSSAQKKLSRARAIDWVNVPVRKMPSQ